MGDIAKGVLGGAWTLLVGWILPTALNLAVLITTLLPTLRSVPGLGRAANFAGGEAALASLTASVMLGLVLNALQNPLYRLLEGYLLWPSFAYERGRRRHGDRRRHLANRLLVMRLERRASEGELSPAAAADLERLQASPQLARHRDLDRRSAIRRALLQEQLARYPVDEGQLAPTRLGNAIRRFEEYAQDRYRLDSQLLWHELTATAPEEARRQVDTARASVDFFVCLPYGHAALAIGTAENSPPNARCGPWSRACRASPTTRKLRPWTVTDAMVPPPMSTPPSEAPATRRTHTQSACLGRA